MNAFDPNRDLVLERVTDVPPERIWQAWTTSELMTQWFTPAPWRTPEAEIDLRPGGIFRTVMAGPEGERWEGTGCFLEVVPNRRLVWTSAMGPGFRPHPVGGEEIPFTAEITMEPEGAGTRYRVVLRHPDAVTKEKHDAMGFEGGWGKAYEQMIELLK